MRFPRWWVRRYVKLYRKLKPKRVVYYDPPRWGDGQFCEVDRNASMHGDQKRLRVVARIESIGPKTVWVRFSDGGVGHFKRHQVTLK